jgi:NADH-ubiquinone oxidoreductase chain 6
MLFNFFTTLTNGYSNPFLLFFSYLSVFLAISIIIAKNPVYSVLFLIGLFLTISLFYMLIGLEFIALAYLLVYVGAISILFIFILMLISIRTSELATEGKSSLPLAAIVV